MPAIAPPESAGDEVLDVGGDPVPVDVGDVSEVEDGDVEEVWVALINETASNVQELADGLAELRDENVS